MGRHTHIVLHPRNDEMMIDEKDVVNFTDRFHSIFFNYEPKFAPVLVVPATHRNWEAFILKCFRILAKRAHLIVMNILRALFQCFSISSHVDFSEDKKILFDFR